MVQAPPMTPVRHDGRRKLDRRGGLMVHVSLSAALVVGAFGCRHAYLDVDARATRWEARGEYRRAQHRYRELLRRAERPAQRDRWRLALALSIIASHPPGHLRARTTALGILRQGESPRTSAIKRRLMAVAGSLEEGDKCQQRLQQIERELLAADKKRAELEQRLTMAELAYQQLLATHSKASEQAHLQLEQLEQARTTIKREREAHKKELGETQKQIARLQRKLAALKRIDMQRRP